MKVINRGIGKRMEKRQRKSLIEAQWEDGEEKKRHYYAISIA